MNQNPHSPFVTKVLLRQSIGSVRLVIALFTVSATATKLLYNRLLPELLDLDEVRWGIIIVGSIFFATTYVRFKRAAVVSYFSLFLYLCTLLYVIAFVIINKFDPNAVAILVLVVGASTVIMNSLFYYGVQCSFIMLASLFAYLSNDLGEENLIQFFNLLIALGVFGIVCTEFARQLRKVERAVHCSQQGR